MNLDFIKRQLTTMYSASATNIQKSIAGDVPSESVRMAMVILGVGPVILIYPFLQRYFIRGLTVGSVKG